ncbi:MAG: N4-gp56 family major capsid protein [Candidatus Sulfotelmatobacter sp.]|nr:N4-gp56 family major capsid protein [Candidatus Sulfotelmatobacter sp.]
MSGYNPASTTANALPQATVTFYDRNFVQNLKLWTLFLRMSERRPLPMNSGNKLELFMYAPFAANIAQISEGVVGSGFTPTVLTTTSTMGAYGDYVSLSDYALQTAIDDALGNLREEIAYRAALSLNTVHRNVVDTGASIDSSVSALSLAYNVTMTKTTFVAMVQSMQGRGIKPFDQAANRFAMLVHPFVVGDALNDTAVGGITDIAKYGAVRGTSDRDALYDLPGEEAPILDIAGIRAYQCQMVTQTPNYTGHAGVTAYRTYVFGQNATFGIALGAKEGAKIGEGEWRNISTELVKNPATSAADPVGVIGGWTSYNLKYAASLGPDTTIRFRYSDAPSNIS